VSNSAPIRHDGCDADGGILMNILHAFLEDGHVSVVTRRPAGE
jgi:hypothetical protein